MVCARHLLLGLVWLVRLSVVVYGGAYSPLGQAVDWWLQRVQTDEDFVFDGSHSDFAQQFLRLFLDGVTAPPIEDAPSPLPVVITNRLRSIDASLAFSELSPLLQRALLWDMGIVKAGLEYVQVYTLCGLRMSKLAVSKESFEDVGCVAQNCSTPAGYLFYQSLYCNGYQIGNASRCATTRGKTPVHAAMWSNGGDDSTLPDTFIAKHEWKDANISYTIYSIRLADDPNPYRTCVAPSMTVPCIAYEQLSGTEKQKWCDAVPSRQVTHWLKAENQIIKDEQDRAKRHVYYAVGSSLAGISVVGGVCWWCYRIKRCVLLQRGARRKEDQRTDGQVSYFFTDDSTRVSHQRHLRRGIGIDPHATAVLGLAGAGMITGFDKTSSMEETRRVSITSVAILPSELDRSSQSIEKDGNHSSNDANMRCVESRTGCGAINESGEQGNCRSPFSIFDSASDGSASDSCQDDRVVTFVSDTATVCTNGTTNTDDSESKKSKELSSPTPSLHEPLAELLGDVRVMAKRVAFVDISLLRQLSKGAYGEIWIGRMRDQLVAVKRLVPERRKRREDVAVFVAEIRLMVHFEHVNVLSLLGVSWSSPGSLCIMMEYLDQGDLQQLLKKTSREDLAWPTVKTQLAVDIAQGLKYLHGLRPKVVHRDLKSKNVLVGDKYSAKLCDFGVSRANEGLETMTCGVGTAYWTAPEVLVGDKYTETADVYSFGVVLTELDTHQLPFYDAVDGVTGIRLEAIRIMHLVCLGERKPSLTTECPDFIRNLAIECMAFDPSERPTPTEIIRRLLATVRNTFSNIHDEQSEDGFFHQKCRSSTHDPKEAPNTSVDLHSARSNVSCESTASGRSTIVVKLSPAGSDLSDCDAIWV